MAKTKEEREIDLIADDLMKLYGILRNAEFCLNPSIIADAAKEIYNRSDKKKWQYSLDYLDFTIAPVGKTVPSGIKQNLNIRFSINLKGQVSTTIIEDVLTGLSFDIDIFAYPNEGENLRCHWHLDRDLSLPGDGKHKFSHPLYHFTFGGNKLYGTSINCGELVVLPSPRIAYPPMDAVLGIDFIIQNYIHKDNNTAIISETQYQSVVSNSQNRFWKPYFNSIATKWNGKAADFGAGFNFNKLLPFLK